MILLDSARPVVAVKATRRGQSRDRIQCGYARTCRRGVPRLMPKAREAVVIGAGPNGLVAANLLADAGWDVLLLEAQSAVGGAVKSDSEWPTASSTTRSAASTRWRRCRR